MNWKCPSNYSLNFGRWKGRTETFSNGTSGTGSLTRCGTKRFTGGRCECLKRLMKGLKELDATVVNALIDKILVSEREKSADGTIRQEIKIYYKFIGFVGESNESKRRSREQKRMACIELSVKNDRLVRFNGRGNKPVKFIPLPYCW